MVFIRDQQQLWKEPFFVTSSELRSELSSESGKNCHSLHPGLQQAGKETFFRDEQRFEK